VGNVKSLGWVDADGARRLLVWCEEIEEIETKWTLAVEMTGERGCRVWGLGFRVYLGRKLEMTG
jgi:hypothetical protein